MILYYTCDNINDFILELIPKYKVCVQQQVNFASLSFKFGNGFVHIDSGEIGQ